MRFEKSTELKAGSVDSNTYHNFKRFIVNIQVRYLQIFVVGFVILSIVIGLSIQEVSQPDSTMGEGPEIVEAGGKIIDVELSDGVTGALSQGER